MCARDQCARLVEIGAGESTSSEPVGEVPARSGLGGGELLFSVLAWADIDGRHLSAIHDSGCGRTRIIWVPPCCDTWPDLELGVSLESTTALAGRDRRAFELLAFGTLDRCGFCFDDPGSV